MTKQVINVGAAANDKQGDSLRAAFQKVNNNFTELYTALGLADDTTLSLGAFEFTGSTMTTTDSTSIVIDQATTITSDLTVGGDVVPQTALGGNLGSAAKPWKSLYVSGSTIYLGNAALSIDDNGEISINDNRLVQDNGNYIKLNSNVNDVNVSNPQPGDTLQWGPGYWINVPNSDHKLVGDGAEVILFTDGPEPYTLFPATSTDDQLQIGGSEISSVSGDLTLTSPTDTLIISNGAGIGGGSQLWTFGDNGNITMPNGGKIIGGSTYTETMSIIPNIEKDTQIGIISQDENEQVAIGTSGGLWQFMGDGTMYIPGDISGSPGMSIRIQSIDSTLRIWEFGGNGDFKLPGNIVSSNDITIRGGDNRVVSLENGLGGHIEIGYQANSGNIYIGAGSNNTTTYLESDRLRITANAPPTSKGTTGDGVGMVAFDNNYIYYCTALYDGISDIWKRVSLIGGTW